MKYKFRTTPYKHQREAIVRLLKNGGNGALLMEPRVGKTKTTIDYLCIQYVKKRITHAVIVAPNRVLGVWLAEFHAHATVPFHLTVWDSDQRKSRQVPPSHPGMLNVLVVNFEAFSSPGKTLASGRRSKSSGRFKNRQLIWKWMNGNPTAGVIDESHLIKNPSGKAANMLVSMRDSFTHRLILTGTPITKANRIFDAYMQWQFLNPDRFADVPTVAEFKDRYGRWEQRSTRPAGPGQKVRGYAKFIGPKNIEELRERIEEDAIIVRREDCFDLPEREDLIRYVELSKTTRERYDQMAEDMIVRLSEEAVSVASIKLVQNLRLSQLTSGFLTDTEGEIHRLSLEKAEALEELLKERSEVGEKVVVAARYKADMDLIRDLGKHLKIPTWSIRGGMKREESDKARHDFQAHDDAGLIVLQPAAAALGIDLSSAAHMVWYSHTPSWVNYTQTCDRIALSRKSTTFTHLVARRSVDEVLLQTLTTDGNLAKVVMGDPSVLLEGFNLDVDATSRLVPSKKSSFGMIDA